MKLDYWTLLSPSPIDLGVCTVRPIRLSDIDSLNGKFKMYNLYLSMILMDIAAYYKIVNSESYDYFTGYSSTEKNTILSIQAEYENMPEDARSKVSFLHIVAFDPKMISKIQEALSFFIIERIEFSYEGKGFLVYKEGELSPSAAITDSAYKEIVDIISQMSNISIAKRYDYSKAKNKITLKVLQKLNKSSAKSKSTQSDKRVELPNLISAISARHPSLNIINIWELTIYQVYDLFSRMQVNNVFDVQMMSVAAWGNKDNKVDFSQWFENRWH